MHNVIIEMSSPTAGKVLVDGTPLQVLRWSASAGLDDLTEVTFTINAKTLNHCQEPVDAVKLVEHIKAMLRS